MTESILIFTEDDGTLDDLLRLCAAAGAEPEVVHGGTVPAGRWERAPLVLLGDDRALARPGPEQWPGRRPGVVLVGRDLDDHTVWERGLALGVEQVVHLPGDEPWLAERIAEAVEPGAPAPAVGVIGGRGGAGASTLACALAVTAAATGLRTTLIDCDPLGGGLDVVLGSEGAAGPRWPALLSARGRLPGRVLDESLPRAHGVRLLSWDRSDAAPLSADAMRSVLAAARRGGGLVVLDLPRTADEAAHAALTQLDLGLLVVPGDLRALAAARRVIATTGSRVRDLRIVARPGAGHGLTGEELSRLLDLPLAGELPDEPGLAAAAERGDPPGRHTRGVLARFCTALLNRSTVAAEVAA
ncbi:septum site-determining protein Ssd [Streptomyces sp. RFCAC02]|uniref:septum site-determining protein Ssd n=1 Tax=Streptomyces sp. RFCAC02 TaxID=2499143 RepID=UPI0010216252|nr:septum site-determining protein Ssd [Streptomyces sp. RFCAC02]